MTDAELIEWAAERCGWEIEGCHAPRWVPEQSAVAILTEYPLFDAAAIDALALQLWRKSGLTCLLLGSPFGAEILLDDSLACIRAIYESGVME